MKTIILFFALIFCATHFYGQSCRISDLSPADKTTLQTFWNDFRTSITMRDSVKLSALCGFPYYCTYCHKKKWKSPEGLLKTQFFFTQEFIDEMNKHDTPEGFFLIHGVYFKTERYDCSYIFPFITQKGDSLYFSVNKINGAYKITSTWTKYD